MAPRVDSDLDVIGTAGPNENDSASRSSAGGCRCVSTWHHGGVTSTDDDRTDTAPGTVWCFQCGNEYDEDVAECLECGVPTTSAAPQQADQVGDVDDDQLAYEFHEWTGQGRSTLDGMLTRQGIAHAWQGATLIVKEADEEAVDAAVAEAEIVAMPTLDLSQPTMVYELDGLDDDQHTRLLRRLGDEGVSHAFDRNGDLFVYERDEDVVDSIFSGLELPDLDEREFGPGLPGVDPVAVMSDLFVAAGRLRKNPSDSKGVIAFVETAAKVVQMTLPYGLGVDVWATVVDRSMELSDALAGDQRGSDDDVQSLAEAIHDMMRQLV